MGTGTTKLMALMNQAAFEQRFDVKIDIEDFIQLRRDAMRLRRWYERCCTNVEVNDGKAYEYDNFSTRWRVPNPEPGCFARISKICKKYTLYFYIQSDPRGPALYLSVNPIDNCRYTNDAISVIE